MQAQIPINDMKFYRMFPDEIKIYQMINSAQISESRQAWKETTGKEWNYFDPHIVGCVSYRSPWGSPSID
jgi:hypothetical protein